MSMPDGAVEYDHRACGTARQNLAREVSWHCGPQMRARHETGRAVVVSKLANHEDETGFIQLVTNASIPMFSGTSTYVFGAEAVRDQGVDGLLHGLPVAVDCKYCCILSCHLVLLSQRRPPPWPSAQQSASHFRSAR